MRLSCENMRHANSLPIHGKLTLFKIPAIFARAEDLRREKTMPSGFSGGRLSGSAEDAKVKGTGKVGGAGKRKKEWIDPRFPPVLF